jgi:tetratricopeptide (TPR) repeat protein
MRLLLTLLALAAATAWAQPTTPEREQELVKALFDAGRFKEALERAEAAIFLPSASDGQRVQLNQYAGLAAYNLGDLTRARRFFLVLLQLNPDHVLDPFAVAPPAIALFEQVRADNAANLNVIRQLLTLKAEEAKRQAAEETKRRGSAGVTRIIERRSWLINLLPFGVPQFSAGRSGWGAFFATAQGLLGAASLFGYIALQVLIRNQVTYTVVDRLDAQRTAITVPGVPANRAVEAQVYNITQLVGGYAFWAAVAWGVIDGLVRHEPERITEGKPSLAPTIVPGGAGVGFSTRF